LYFGQSDLQNCIFWVSGDELLSGELMNWIEELREACVGEKPRTGSMTKQMPKGVNTRLPAFACVFHRHTSTNKVWSVVHLVLNGVL
jgi:hypothetical protein